MINDDEAHRWHLVGVDGTDRRQAAELLSSLYRDDLTGALLRRPGRLQLESMIRRARADSTPLYILFFDVDGLKAINDRDGHCHGDRALASLGTALHTSLRGDDAIVRYGGDEFVCGLVAMTQADASDAIRRVQHTLTELSPHVTVSAGYAQLEASDDLDEVIKRADADLYNRRRRRRSGDAKTFGKARQQAARVEAGAAVSCGACAAPISLDDFVMVSQFRKTRRATCPSCGEITLLLLAAAANRATIDLDHIRPPGDGALANGDSESRHLPRR